MPTPHTPPATTRPRGQRPGHDETTWPRGPRPVPDPLEGWSGHRPTAGGRTQPRDPPLPPAPTHRQTTPATLLRELAALLRSHGLDHLYATATTTEGVLSVTANLTIWTNGHTLRCHTPTHTIHLPTSTHTAARRIAALTGHTPPRQEDTPSTATPPTPGTLQPPAHPRPPTTSYTTTTGSPPPGPPHTPVGPAPAFAPIPPDGRYPTSPRYRRPTAPPPT